VEDLNALAFWYETSPNLGQVSQVNMALTFTNNSGETVEFSAVANETLQLWTTPSVEDPLPVYHSFPTGFVANGENFSYDISIDTSNMPATDIGFGIRPHTINLGNLGPNSDRSLLVSAAFACEPGIRFIERVIPSSSAWSRLTILFLLLVTAAWALRKRIH